MCQSSQYIFAPCSRRLALSTSLIMDTKDPGYQSERVEVVKYESEGSSGIVEEEVVNGSLQRGLKGRHMQMIAIGMLSGVSKCAQY